jgi:hypothetical protein
MTEPSDAAFVAVRLAQELRHVEPIRDSAWLTPEVVDALERMLDLGIILAGPNLRDGR